MASQHSSPPAPRPLRRWGRAVATAVAVVAVAVPAALGSTAAAEPVVHPGPPSLEGARTVIADAQAERADALARRARLQAELAATHREINALGLEQAALAHELEIARRRVRVVTVRAYTGGGGAREFEYLMDATDVGEHLYRQELLTGNAVDTHQAIEDFEDLRSQADERVVELAERVDDIGSGIDEAGRDIELAAAQIRRAQVELSAARAAAAQNAGGRTDPGEGAWGRLRFCESGGVYSTDSGNGFYGAYQFDLQTWQSMGGTGRPSAAPYWEQDLRAKGLFQARGAQPWPICGRFLS